ncbi:MAG TPA: UvrD-helicase domain-containing protein [Acidisarcina sp.]|nr:UvrD-helicase domain-containing protein [Acidisarcina sp.]
MIESEATRYVDSAARAEALDTSDSCIVQAPAGSGKTELLTQRFLQLLSEVDSPDQILAITFTRAATAEMRRRILESMEHAMSDESDPALEPARRALRHAERQGWDLLRNPQLLKIETIDSFCLSLAHRTPLLARLGGTFQPTEAAGALYSLAARRTLQRLGGSNRQLTEAIQTLLELRDNGLAECEQLIANMLARRDQWRHAFVFNEDEDWQSTVRQELEKPMARAIRRVLERLTGMLEAAGENGQDLAELAAFSCRNLQSPECIRHKHNFKRIAALAALDGFPSHAQTDVDAWKAVSAFLLTGGQSWRQRLSIAEGFLADSASEKNRFHALVHRLEAIPGFHEALCEVDSLPPAHYTEEQWVRLSRLFLTLRQATAELRVIFAEQNTVDFVEISFAAAQVLRYRDEVLGETPTEFGLAASDQVRHLLVDEFQDTSRSQQELLQMLVSGWLPGEGRTCFLVGDPMQSIYLFRQAEVELFHHARLHGLGSGPDALPLKNLQLTTNFRSHRGVVDRLNELLEPIFAQGSNPDAASVEFTPSEASDPAFVPDSVHILPNLIAPPASGRVSIEARQQAQEDEASQILTIVEAHLAQIDEAKRNNKSYTIAILSRARNHLLPVAEKLRQSGVRFRAVEMENLGDRQEVLDLTSLLKALLHPMDRVAWLAVLRAPWCGLTLADLHQLCGADDKLLAKIPVLQLLRTRIGLLSADGQQRARRTHMVLEAALEQRYRQSSSQPLAVWLERVWHSLGGHECVDAIAYENAQVFFSMLEKMDADGIGCLGEELRDRLTRLFAQPDPESSESAGIQLMTIHKAKGLGFDIVIVPGLDRQPNGDKAKLLLWLERSIPASDETYAEEGDSEILVAPIGEKGKEADSLYSWVKKQEKMRLDEEQKRLFYVACTRARRELHLLGTALIQAKTDKKTQEVTYSLTAGSPNSLLRTAWPSLEAPFLQALQAWQEKQSATPAPDNLLPFPPLSESPLPGVYDLAAAEEQPATLRRLPESFVPEDFRTNVPVIATYSSDSSPETLFERPAGSIRARAFGVAVHALLEKIARTLAEGTAILRCQQSLAEWRPAIENKLRSEGVSSAQASSLASEVIRAASEALDDEVGRWILSPHLEARNEVSWSGWVKGSLRNVRIDRVFRAGEDVAAPGADVYWIMDYKTASHSASGLAEFLAKEKQEYEPQLAAYAEVLRLLNGPTTRIKLGLYYPLLRKLVSWSA